MYSGTLLKKENVYKKELVMQELIEKIFGLNLTSQELDLIHIAARSFFVFFMGVFLVRIQPKFVAVSTSFSYLLNFTLGSLLASAIVSQGAFFPILGATLLLSFTNFTIAYVCFKVPFLERIFKGKGDVLVFNGRVIWGNMRRNLVSYQSLLEAVMKEVGKEEISEVKKAYIETDGDIVVIKKKQD